MCSFLTWSTSFILEEYDKIFSNALVVKTKKLLLPMNPTRKTNLGHRCFRLLGVSTHNLSPKLLVPLFYEFYYYASFMYSISV